MSSPASPAFRIRAAATVVSWDSRACMAGTTSAFTNWSAVTAMLRCSSVNSSGTKTSFRVTWSLSAAASTLLFQNGVRSMPSDSAGISTTAIRSGPPSGSATATLALIRFIEYVRLHGFLTPLTVMPPSA